MIHDKPSVTDDVTSPVSRIFGSAKYDKEIYLHFRFTYTSGTAGVIPAFDSLMTIIERRIAAWGFKEVDDDYLIVLSWLRLQGHLDLWSGRRWLAVEPSLSAYRALMWMTGVRNSGLANKGAYRGFINGLCRSLTR